MLRLLTEGRMALESLGCIGEEFRYLVNLGRFMECFAVTGIHVKDWYRVATGLPVADTREEVEKLIAEGERILASERENVQRAIPLVQADSRLGWDTSATKPAWNGSFIFWITCKARSLINSESQTVGRLIR